MKEQRAEESSESTKQESEPKASPLRLQGKVLCTRCGQKKIRVVALANSLEPQASLLGDVLIEKAGPFQLDLPKRASSMYVIAFVDDNDDGRPDPDEIEYEAQQNPLQPQPTQTQIDGLTLHLDPNNPAQSKKIDATGGELSLSIPPLFHKMLLRVPAGTLDKGESVQISFRAFHKPKPSPLKIHGAQFLFRYQLTITPESLAHKVRSKMEVEFWLDRWRMPTEQRKAFEADREGWLASHLFVAGRREDLNVTYKHGPSVPVCEHRTYNKDKHFWIQLFDTKGKAIGNGTVKRRYARVVSTPEMSAAVVNEGRNKLSRSWYIDTEGEVRFALQPIQRFSTSSTHAWNLRFSYYPISVSRQQQFQPVVPWPTKPSDQFGVERCIIAIFKAVFQRLTRYGFRKFYEHGLPWDRHILIHDFSANPSLGALSNMEARTMKLPTAIVDPSLYKVGGRWVCLNPNNPRLRDLVQSIAHEVWHWQQGAYVSPQLPKRIPRQISLASFGAKSFISNEISATKATPYYVKRAPTYKVRTIRYRKHGWLLEGTARYFERMMAGSPELLFGLSSFPINGRPWRLLSKNGRKELFIDQPGRWDYYKSFFFKFLFDQESKSTSLKAEMQAMRSLFEDFRQYLWQNYYKTNTGPKQLDYNPLVWAWMKKRGLTWFDFFREFMFLRGCASAGTCPEVPKSRTKPFAVKPVKALNLFGNPEHPDLWTPLFQGKDRHSVNDQPYSQRPQGWSQDYTPMESGQTLASPQKCMFDSTIPGFRFGPASASIVGLKVDKDYLHSQDIQLPNNIQTHLSGVRIDIWDDVNYVDKKQSYTWHFEFDQACPKTLRYEAWSRDTQLSGSKFTIQGTLKYLGEATNTGKLKVSLPKRTDKRGRYLTLLVGNTSLDQDTPCRFIQGQWQCCRLKIRITHNHCPCVSTYVDNKIYPKRGGTLICKKADGFRGELCNPGRFVEAIKFMTPIDYQNCWDQKPSIRSFCKLTRTSLKP